MDHVATHYILKCLLIKIKMNFGSNSRGDDCFFFLSCFGLWGLGLFSRLVYSYKYVN